MERVYRDNIREALRLADAEITLAAQINDWNLKQKFCTQIANDLKQFETQDKFRVTILQRSLWFDFTVLSILFACAIAAFILPGETVLPISLSGLVVVLLGLVFDRCLGKRLEPTWELHEEIGEALVKQYRSTIQHRVWRVSMTHPQIPAHELNALVHSHSLDFLFEPGETHLYKAQREYVKSIVSKNERFHPHGP